MGFFTQSVLSLLIISSIAPLRAPPATASRSTQNAGARDPVSVSAGKSKEQQQKQAEFDVRYAEAMALRRARVSQSALDKFQQAEQLSSNLPDTKYSWLQEILAGEADCLIALNKFSEAETVLLRRGDALRIVTNELDSSYAYNFSLLADLSAKQQDWYNAELYLRQALKAHDKSIAYLTGSRSWATLIQEECREKAFDIFHLGITYSHQGKYAEALVACGDSFTMASQAHAPSQQLTPIATAAKEIAVHTGYPTDVEKWHRRLAALSGDGEPSKD